MVVLLPEVLGENHFFAFPAPRGHWHALACGPLLYLPASSIASSNLPLILTLPLPSPTSKNLVIPLGAPGKSRVTSPTQGHPGATLVSSANLIPLCCATQHFHRFQGLGCGHLESGGKEEGRWALFYLAQPSILLISLSFLEKNI